jgi:tetratricopeptide (TPR) repeat protein
VEKVEAERLAKKAVELGHDDPVTLASAGIAMAFVVGRVLEGGEMIDRSLDLNPGLAAAWMYSGWVKAWSGEPDEAIRRVDHALSLSPHDPYIASMRRAKAFSHFIAGRYEDAITSAEAVGSSPQNAGIAAASVVASAVMLGRINYARSALNELLRTEPGLRMHNLRSRFPLVKDDDYRRFAQALRQAGLGE